MDKEKDSPVLYTEDTQTPTNVDTTAQAPITKDAEGNILDAYADKKDPSQYAGTPKTTTETQDSNTGTGLSAAEGTTYSWETKAAERAQMDYKADVLESKEKYLSNRQEIETAAKEAQNQFSMAEYSQNQSSEKAGWTGGYILDTERQMSYLKETIQAQMYGQMELQKYGYDTSLAAARLAYDTNKYDLALEYYNTALQRAVTEAEITGYYVSPELSEMLNQYTIASTALNNGENVERNEKILESIYTWLESNNISKEGRITSAQFLQEFNMRKAVYELYDMDTEDLKTYTIDKDAAFKLDENGEWKMNKDGTADTFSWKDMSAEEIITYINSSDIARDQYYARLDLTAYEVENGFTEWCIKNGYANKDAEGNITSFNKDDYSTVLTNYLASEGENLLQEELNKFESSDPEAIKDLLSNWNCPIKLPDGSTATLSLTPKTSESSSGIKVGDTIVNKDGTTNFDYKGYYLTGEDGETYVKDCKDIGTLSSVLQGNPEMAEVLKILEIDPRSENYATKVADWMGAVTPVLAGAGTLAGPAGTILGTAAGVVVQGGWDLIDDLFVQAPTSQAQKQQVEFLSETINNIENFIGESNMTILEEASNKYQNLSDRDKASLTEDELKQLQYAYQLTSSLKNYREALDYAEARDSNIWQDPWEYIGDNWKADYEDIWDNGYQFGDVTHSIVTGVVDVVESGAAVVVGGVQWLWNVTAGSWFGWKW